MLSNKNISLFHTLPSATYHDCSHVYFCSFLLWKRVGGCLLIPLLKFSFMRHQVLDQFQKKKNISVCIPIFKCFVTSFSAPTSHQQKISEKKSRLTTCTKCIYDLHTQTYCRDVCNSIQENRQDNDGVAGWVK